MRLVGRAVVGVGLDALDRRARDLGQGGGLDLGGYPLDVAAGVLDARPTVLAVADVVAAGVEPAVVAARFPRAGARATAQACAEVAATRGLDTVVLAGGVWQNRLLLELTLALLRDGGLRVLVPERLPPNDGAFSFGQAAVAAALRAATR